MITPWLAAPGGVSLVCVFFIVIRICDVMKERIINANHDVSWNEAVYLQNTRAEPISNLRPWFDL